MNTSSSSTKISIKPFTCLENSVTMDKKTVDNQVKSMQSEINKIKEMQKSHSGENNVDLKLYMMQEKQDTKMDSFLKLNVAINKKMEKIERQMYILHVENENLRRGNLILRQGNDIFRKENENLRSIIKIMETTNKNMVTLSNRITSLEKQHDNKK
jgi:membrane-associated HD superfamily phosphohydrolase